MTTVTVYDDVSLIPSFWILGFFILSRQGKINLRFKHGKDALIPNEDRKWKSTLFEVSANGKSRLGLIDIFDRYDSINPKVLDLTDQYFKFNFNEEFINANVTSGHGKIFRTGFYFPVKYDPASSFYTGRLRKFIAGFQARKETSFTNRLRDARNCSREYRTLMTKFGYLEYYTIDLRSEKQDLYDFFWNVNYWSPKLDDVYHSVATSNQRVAIMDILKRTKEQSQYKLYFGFYDNLEANRDYPAYVMKPMLPTKEYLRTVARSKMSIVSRGLFDCLSWRMGEHMAMGRFALNERPLNQSYIPLMEGTNAVFFENDLSDLEDKVLYYLKNDDERQRIANEAAKYFDQYCRPEIQIKYMINNMISGAV